MAWYIQTTVTDSFSFALLLAPCYTAGFLVFKLQQYRWRGGIAKIRFSQENALFIRIWSILPLLLKLFHSRWKYPLDQGIKQPFWQRSHLLTGWRGKNWTQGSCLPRGCWNRRDVCVREVSLCVQGNKGTVRSGWCKCQTQMLWDPAGHSAQNKTCGETKLNAHPSSVFLTGSTPPRQPAPAISIVGAELHQTSYRKCKTFTSAY